ncbi:MAG: LTA synthase family protein [Clostridiales bacterium]|jgi:phosphoglycerol transferase MdoB-like AlkP superfamily enzyme|nr:LTA synthase family protein [Clostridiales bacterium]
MRIKPDKNILFPMLFFIGTLIYLELVNHLYTYNNLDGKTIYPILFAIPMGIFFTILSGVFNRYGNMIIMWLITSFSCLIFGLQLVYYRVFKVYFSFRTLGMVRDVISEFGNDVNNAISSNIVPIILVLFPLVGLYFLLKNVFLCEKRKPRHQSYLLIGALSFHLLALLFLPLYGKADYTPYDLYYHSKVPELSGQQLGIITLTRNDLSGLLRENDEVILVDNDNLIFMDELDSEESIPTVKPQPTKKPESIEQDISKEEPTNIPTAIPTPIPDRSPNIMNIDFEELAKNEDNQAIKTLHSYFASIPPTNKNEYTGMFKGYNLILITAEGFSTYAVHKEVTPTLYKLTNEGFIFNNFYTALWQTSTSDGEYVALTGLIPVGSRSMYISRNNLLPFTLGHQFNLMGMESKAYHNHSYTYYERNETHPNLGYIFTGKGNGLELDSDVWPASDLEMIEYTVDEYINEDPFHIYYLTVSGHMNYSFVGNSMSFKNRDLVKDLPYSSDARAYIACQIELDRALEELIKRLNEAGIAEKTVIALSSDHYPYGWEKEKLDELAGHEVDTDFEIYRNHFILWNPGMETNIIIDEPASSLDILPTLSNLFGLTYDSRLMMGRDILSDSDPLVILSNRSFITDKLMYNSSTGESIYLTDEELHSDYVKNINAIIKNKFTVSGSMSKMDYYRYVFPNYPEGFLTE